jgi:hypothetical protein
VNNKVRDEFLQCLSYAMEANGYDPTALEVTDGRDRWLIRFEVVDKYEPHPIYFAIRKNKQQTLMEPLVGAALLAMGANAQAARRN